MTKQVIAEHWSDGECHKQRRSNGYDVSKGERRKHSAFKASEAKQRQKYENDDQRRKEDRIPDFARRFEDYSCDWLRCRRMCVLFQPPKHILDVDDCIVNEGADCDRQSAECHRVYRNPEIAHHDDCCH